MTQVQISQLKSHLSEHLRRAEGGEVFEILDRARPIAKLVPIDDQAGDGLEIIPARRPFNPKQWLNLPPADLKVDLVELLRADRDAR